MGSKAVCEDMEFSFSSATIRSEMVGLSELGYIFQPHVSSGRVPWDQGYSLYINKLMQKKIRKLTPSEALNLQGFDSEFYLRCKKNGLSDHQIYKQAGNAVSVNVVYAILHYLFIKLSLR